MAQVYWNTKTNKQKHSIWLTAVHQAPSRNWTVATDLQRHDIFMSFLLFRGYLWDRLSASRSDQTAGQRRWLQQTHHWSRKNWQHWLCMMHCQLKTTGWRGKTKTETINQQKGKLIRIQTVHQQLIVGWVVTYFKEDQTLHKSPKHHIQ